MKLTFGSPAILDGCWSPKELEGSSEDKRTIKSSVAEARLFSEKTRPKHTLPILSAELQNSIRGVIPAGNLKLIALTFDLCDDASEVTRYDADIANYLRRNKIKATFFASGKWMLSHPEKTMQLMPDPFFEIGNHGWTPSVKVWPDNLAADRMWSTVVKRTGRGVLAVWTAEGIGKRL